VLGCRYSKIERERDSKLSISTEAIRAVPQVELRVHLEGSLQPHWLQQLSRAHHVDPGGRRNDRPSVGAVGEGLSVHSVFLDEAPV